ncbi:MAG: hypothetical protein AAB480_04215 [Patescibacteria group bacterium]
MILGSVVNLFGTSYYILNTVRGVTKPNRMTWLMWSIAPLIGAAAGFASGVTWAALPVLMAGIMPLTVFIASFVNPNSYWELGVFDYFCGSLSMLALILWYLTQNPAVAIVFAIASDLAAAIPTVIKCWSQPETETASGYTASGFNNLMSFFVITNWNFASIAFPLHLVFINTVLAFPVVRKKRSL